MSGDGKKNPVPQGKYVPATRFGDIVFTAGMTPRDNGVLIMQGKVMCDQPVECYKGAVAQAASNAFAAAGNMLKAGERLGQILSITVFVNAEEGFSAHSKLADFASEFFVEEMGEAGIGSRAAVGVASLPGDAPVEIQIIAGVCSDEGGHGL